MSDRLQIISLLGAAGALLISCAGTSPLPEIKTPLPAGASADAWNRIHQSASEQLQCPIAQLNTKLLASSADEVFTKRSFEISGCDGTVVYFLADRVDGAFLAYSDWDLRQKLKFSYGEKCPDWSIEFIDGSTRGVTACGQKLVYVHTTSGWVANTVTDSSGKTE
ncbi:MAG: hypothetical protein HYV09_15675 [Deltaproteobacteria bacterium]|nr:hypothetical protein [Deltaproteobacteria bacterium]